MESEMISCENVKPSSPTPPDLQTYKFSMFDQAAGSILVPLVMYFGDTSTSATDDTIDHHHLAISRKIEQLKSSLSVTLTRFYPVAGRASADCESIDCKDQGVPLFVENIKGHQVSDLLKPSPDPALWAQLLPCQLGQEWGAGCNVAMIKISHFECGGVAIGVVFWHKVFDAVSMANFLKYWGATSRGLPSPDPSYILCSLFPGKEELAGPTAKFIEQEKFVSRVYVFDGPAIRKLKARSSSNVVDSPSRVEVVTALLWKCFTVACLANHEKPVASAISHAVNLRRRVRPLLPSECFGNMTTSVFATYSNTNYDAWNDREHELLRHLVREIRGATRKIDDEYVKRMRGENTKLVRSRYTEGADLLSFTSWCGMGFYDVDFGRGRPVWITINNGSQMSCSRNMVLLMDTKLGDGVEAWVILKTNYMKVFENVEELRYHASISLL